MYVAPWPTRARGGPAARGRPRLRRRRLRTPVRTARLAARRRRPRRRAPVRIHRLRRRPLASDTRRNARHPA
ncbi:hypothetical protein BRC72_11405 [Halobacteriales archaeon QH_7_66_36]|nr:MAG: hypothetical protein BRC72_11405 [Halobacteriales archaeon QH_7_66_36]